MAPWNICLFLNLGLILINFPTTLATDTKDLSKEDAGSPLFLTKLINEGQIQKAQSEALVKNFTEVLSYSGFLTVNETYNSNLFFWFFPAHTNPETAPLLLWLQGGPGESSMFGLFTEHGPFQLVEVGSSFDIILRSTAWTLTHSVIYLDSPVGAGFSFTENDAGYATTQVDVADNLYKALIQFFKLFPAYQKNDFFIGGESYGGKYVPAISYKIHQENSKGVGDAGLKINLKGLLMGNAFLDPLSTLDYGKQLFNLGLIDLTAKAHFQMEEDKTRQLVEAEKYLEAFQVMDKLLLGSKESSLPTYFEQVTGFQAIYNLLRTVDPPEFLYFKSFVQFPWIRKSIHVGNRTFLHFDLGGPVADHLENEIYQSVKPWIEQLLDAPENYKILFYTGQLDLAVGIDMVNNLMKNLRWKGVQSFQNATNQIWRVENEEDGIISISGYYKSFGPLTTVIIRNSGHRVPFDQPEWAFDMINRFTATGRFRFAAE